MKRCLICTFILAILILGGCNKQKATDIVVNDAVYSDTVKKDNSHNIQSSAKQEYADSDIEKAAKEYNGDIHKCNEKINISGLDITIKGVKIGNDVIEQDAREYFKTDWIQKGSISNYNSENMSLIYVYVNVNNTMNNSTECPIGMAAIGSYYGSNRFYRMSECAALYPSAYKETTHCLFDTIMPGEEKTYILLFKMSDKYIDSEKEVTSKDSAGQDANQPQLCLELAIDQSVQGKNAPLVILDNKM